MQRTAFTVVGFGAVAVCAAAGVLVIFYLYVHQPIPDPANILFLVPLLLPFVGGLLLGLLRHRADGNVLFGGGAGALGAGLTTLALPLYFCGAELGCHNLLGKAGAVVLGVAASAALLGGLLSGSGAWLAGRVRK